MKTKSRPILPLVLSCLCGIGAFALAEETAATNPSPARDAGGRVIPPEMAALKPEPLALKSDSDHEDRGGWFIPRNSPLQRFYAGVSYGPIWTDYSDTVDDGSVFGVNHGDVGTAANFFLGYNINDYLGLETSYTFVDNVDFAATSTGTGNSWSAGPVGAEFEADVFAFILVGRYPVAPRWTIIGKIGFCAGTPWKPTLTTASLVLTKTMARA